MAQRIRAGYFRRFAKSKAKRAWTLRSHGLVQGPWRYPMVRVFTTRLNCFPICDLNADDAALTLPISPPLLKSWAPCRVTAIPQGVLLNFHPKGKPRPRRHPQSAGAFLCLLRTTTFLPFAILNVCVGPAPSVLVCTVSDRTAS